MKVLIVYDSIYGNTEQIAREIGGAITPSNEVKVVRTGEANPLGLGESGLLVIGSPTQAGRPTPAIQEFLAKISALKGVNVAAFDTRIPARWVGIFGYAAGKIADNLKSKGANLIAFPAGFFVKGKEGPLKDGELERSAGWAREISK